MFVWFGPDGVKSVETREVAPGIMLDLDSEGRVIGIEVLDPSERMIRGRPQPDGCGNDGPRRASREFVDP
jgi:hypothetical protein